jgi:hypothetical protein
VATTQRDGAAGEGLAGRLGVAAWVGEVLLPPLHSPDAEAVELVGAENGVVPRHRLAVAEVPALLELERGDSLTPQPIDHRAEVALTLGRDSHPHGPELCVGQVTDPEQFEVGLAAVQVATGPRHPGAGRRAHLEVGELPQIGGMLDGVGGFPVDHPVGVVVEQKLPVVALVGLRTLPSEP